MDIITAAGILKEGVLSGSPEYAGMRRKSWETMWRDQRISSNQLVIYDAQYDRLDYLYCPLSVSGMGWTPDFGCLMANDWKLVRKVVRKEENDGG